MWQQEVRDRDPRAGFGRLCWHDTETGSEDKRGEGVKTDAKSRVSVCGETGCQVQKWETQKEGLT